MKKQKLLFLFVAFVLLAALVYFAAKKLFTFGPNEFVALLQSFGPFAGAVFFLLVVLETVFAPLPSIIIYPAGGILFGTWQGGTIALAANIVGAFLCFKLAQTYLRGIMVKYTQPKELTLFDQYMQKYGAYALFFLRINPITSSDFFSYLAGLTKMKTWQFLVSTVLGLLPWVYLQSYVGASVLLENKKLMWVFFVLSGVYMLLVVYGSYRIFHHFLHQRMQQMQEQVGKGMDGLKRLKDKGKEKLDKGKETLKKITAYEKVKN